MADTSLVLDAESLMSKWGFDDGDALDEWWWDRFNTSPGFKTDELLYALVLAYLMPAVRAAGHEIELVRIETVHNPVQARSLDDAEVDYYGVECHFNPPVRVSVSVDQVLDMVTKIVRTRPMEPMRVVSSERYRN